MANNEAGAFLNITPDVLKKLDSFDEKLEKIEKHAHTAADALKNGFGSVVVDTSKLENAITSLAKKIDAIKGNPFEGAGKGAEETTRKTTSLNESLSRAADLLNRISSNKIGEGSFSNLNISGLKQGYSDLKKYVENMDLSKPQQKAAVEAMRYMKMELDEQRKTDEQRAQSAEKAAQRKEAADRKAAKAAADLANAQRSTPQGALDYSKNTRSLKENVQAIEYLKKARLSLNTTDANYKNTLNQINQAIARHNQALTEAGVKSQQLATRHRNLMDTAGQLSRQLALVFSVSQIEGYISKIVRVRGEFELQQVALRAIIQDRDKADKIFSQTLNQALKSPFQAGQLITFTKQLAAYRIESGKLLDTTKRLADVSAGLGVSMDRLILAYGQVKAAAYLRGTEVRQFTEAGINLYGELQRYFEEVKGEAYTTAQIVDMISKRMVKFEDVEAVFKRMTDEGGLFFNMQEVQVNTLHGQIERLKDVIALMMNEVGKSNQEGFLSISTAINLANTLLENWRTVASVLKTVVAAYGTLKAVSGIMWIAERAYMAKDIAQQRVRISLKWQDIMATRAQAAANAANGTAIAGAVASQRSLNAAMAANPYGAILAVVVALGTAIYEVVQNTNRLQKALDGIAAEGAFSSVQSANNYAKLAATVADSTKSYQEHNKALAELKSKYSDILPEQYLNAEGIKALNGNYKEAIKTIHQYINAKTKERMIDEVGQEANKEMYANQQKTAKAIAKIVEEQHGMKVSWSDISGILSQVQDKLMNGTIKSVRQLRKETEKVVEEYTGLRNIDLSDYFTRLSGSSFGGADKFRFEKVQIESNQFVEWFKSAESYLTKIEDIGNRFNRDVISLTAQRYQSQKDEADKMIANAMSAYDVLREAQKENTKVTKEELENARSLVQKVLKAIGSDVKVDSEYMSKLFNDSFFFEDEKRNATQAKLRQLFEKLKKEAKESGDNSGAVWLQEFEKQINGLDLTPLQNSIKKFMLGISGNEDIQANWNIRTGETEEEFKKRIKTEIDTRNEIIRKSQLSPYPEYGQDTTKVKSELEELNKLYNGLGGDNKKGRSSAERDIWSERISVLKEMQSRYEKLNQLMGENRAIEETRSAFKGALDFTQMGEVIKAEDIIPTKQGMIDALEKLLKQIPNDVKNAAKRTGLEKEIAELKIGIQQDYLKEQLEKTKKNMEDMFNGLDLHKKLKDAGLSEAEVQQLFPGLAKTLDDVEKEMKASYEKNFPKGEYLVEGTDANKQYLTDLDKLNQQRTKEQEDLVAELTKAYKTQLSDQLQLDRWYYEERTKIAKANLTEEQKAEYESNLQKQYGKKSDENTWKQFQNSDMYISMFENIESSSTRMLEAMRDKLASLRENLKNLPADQLKAIINQQEKIDEMISQKNPFSGLTSGVKEYIQFLKQRKELEEENIRANNAVAYYTEQKNAQSQIVQQKKQEYDAAVEIYGVNSEQANQLRIQWLLEKSILDAILAQLVAEGKITEETAEQIRNGQKLGKTLSDKFSEIGNYLSEFSSGITSVASDLENVFGTMSAGTADTISSIAEIASGLGQTASGVARAIANPADIGAYFQAIGGLAKTIGSIFSIGDKKKEREIQRHIKNIEQLQKSYETLKKAMDDAWDITKLQKYGNELNSNIYKQIASLQAMIAAERDKKKTDQAKIDEWKAQIEDLQEMLKENSENMIVALGGVGSDANFKTLAHNFAEAWLEAFRETGDGLSGLEQTFDEFIQNYVIQQLMLLGVNKYLKPLFDELDEIIKRRIEMSTEEKDRYFELQNKINKLNKGAETGPTVIRRKMKQNAEKLENSEEYKQLQKKWEQFTNPIDLDKALEEWAGKTEGAIQNTDKLFEYIYNKISFLFKDKGGKAELSSLTQSIQGITEREAEALESLLNSIRFFVAQQTSDISAIRALLDARYSLESEYSDSNPMLVELRAQTGYLEILSDRIDRVFAPSPNSKGPALRVVMQ